MIDLHNTNNVRKHDMTAEQVIMSPNGRFLALKGEYKCKIGFSYKGLGHMSTTLMVTVSTKLLHIDSIFILNYALL